MVLHRRRTGDPLGAGPGVEALASSLAVDGSGAGDAPRAGGPMRGSGFLFPRATGAAQPLAIPLPDSHVASAAAIGAALRTAALRLDALATSADHRLRVSPPVAGERLDPFEPDGR